MSYATLEDLCEQFGYREVSELLSDEEGLVTEALLRSSVAGEPLDTYTPSEQLAIAAAVSRASDVQARQAGLIDSKLAVRYQLPLDNSLLSGSPVVECELALTRAALADDGDNVSKRILADRDRWLTWLDSLAKDKAILIGAQRIEVGGSEQQRLVGSPASAVDWSTY